MTIHTSAPATLMLMGEHAVLHGKGALVAAINQRLHVYLTPRQDQMIYLHSDLGNYQISLADLPTGAFLAAPFEFVMTTILSFRDDLKQGFELYVESEFSPTIGFGSSAAVIVATALALMAYLNQSLPAFNDTKLSSPAEKQKDWIALHNVVYPILLSVQGQGSGADLAGAIAGGIVYFRTRPLLIERLPSLLPLCAVYSGSKMKTRAVIATVEALRMENPALFEDYFNQIDEAVTEAHQAICRGDLPRLALAMQANQQLMVKLGVSNGKLDDIVMRLQHDKGVLAAKISGSGLGDCVIGLGQLQGAPFPQHQADREAGIRSIDITLRDTGGKVHDH